MFSLRISKFHLPRASVGGHWCNNFCLPVLGPTRGFCRHQTRVFRGLTWLKSLYNGRNHFVVASHHLSWHHSRSRPSPTASSDLTVEIPGPCGGGVRLGSCANHRGPLRKSSVRQGLAFWGAYFSLGPTLMASEGCGVCFLFGGVLLRFALEDSWIGCDRFLWANYHLFWQGRYY